nr:hypothetical protein [uncultured Pseudodesulfovibrio sp.]
MIQKHRLLSIAGTLLFGAFFGYILFQYLHSDLFSRLGLSSLKPACSNLAKTGFFAASATAAGSFILASCRVVNRDAFIHLATSFMVGLWFFGVATLLMLCINVLSPTLSLSLLGGGLIIGGPSLYRSLVGIYERLAATQLSFEQVCLLFVLVVNGLLSFGVCLAPSVAGDAVKYHLTISKHLATIGSFNIDHFYSDLAYVNLAVLIRALAEPLGQIGVQLVNGPAVIVMAIIGSYGYARTFVNRSWALILACLVWITPEVIFALYKSGYHPTWYLAEALALGAGATFLLGSCDEKDKNKSLTICAFALGFGFWCYYPMTVTATLLGGCILISLLKSRTDKTVKTIIRFIGTAFFVALPVFIGNGVTSGNPIFPILNTYFGLEALNVHIGTTPHTGILGSITVFWDMIMKTLPNSGIKHPSIGILLLLPLTLIPRAWCRKSAAAFGYTCIAYIIWYILFSSSRHFVPVSMSLCFTLVLLGNKLKDKAPARIIYWPLIVAFGIILLSQGMYYFSRGERLRYIVGSTNQSDYLKWGLKSAGAFPQQKVTACVNQLPDDARILAIHFQAPYYLNRPIITVYQKLGRNILNAQSSEAFLQQAKAHGITHLLINRPLVERLFYVPPSGSLDEIKKVAATSLVTSQEFQGRYLEKICGEQGTEGDQLFKIVGTN